MKTIILSLVILVLSFQISSSQIVQGEIFYEDSGITVIKVFGTHQDRGYAAGYLLADKIKDLYENYIVPSFGSYLSTAKLLLSTNTHIAIDSVYIYEAMAMMQGITDAGVSMPGVDYVDLLVANSFLDIENLASKKINMSNGCSSLISWGDATAGTDIDGKTVISRHLDWSTEPAIIRNQVIVIHLPYEVDEQPWALIGFAGQISALSGFNQSGLVAMQHMLADNYASGQMSKGYEPIWFTLRKSLENKDYNGDDVNNVQDVKDAVLSNINGYADSYIVTAAAVSASGHDTLIAAVAEVTPDLPYFSLRDNKYPDSIPGDNLYAANSSISRNNSMNLCMRYNAVHDNIGDGTEIGSVENWNIMKQYSSSCGFGGTGNIQFMQFIPDDLILRLSVHEIDGTQACENDSIVFDCYGGFFAYPLSAEKPMHKQIIRIYPNPSNEKTIIVVPEKYVNSSFIIITNVAGEIVCKMPVESANTEITGMKSGLFMVSLMINDLKLESVKMIVE